MDDTVWRVQYYYTVVPNQIGAGAKVLNALKKEAVDLVALNAFPISPRRAQIDFVAPDLDAFLAAAKKLGIKLAGPRVAFLIQGKNRVGAVADALSKLAIARVNVTATQAVSSGEGRYGVIIWVKPQSVDRAARALGVS
jgi:hypothetical protein